MRYVFVFAALALASGCASSGAAMQRSRQQQGQAIVEQHCSGCHATGRAGDSSAPEAPPFRSLSHNYRVDALEEALAEGISVGHPAMPQFAFAPDDAHAVVAYLQSIQNELPPAQE
jgi:mono/diheme cytochrome c family protein